MADTTSERKTYRRDDGVLMVEIRLVSSLTVNWLLV